MLVHNTIIKPMKLDCDITSNPYLSFSNCPHGKGNGNPLQYSCLENPMDGGAWWATIHGVAKSLTWLIDFTFTPWRRKWQPTPVFFPGESQGRWSLVAAIYGVIQSRTQLKWLSSSSSSREEERKASISERPSLYQESEDRIWLVNKISVCISGLHDSKQ